MVEFFYPSRGSGATDTGTSDISGLEEPRPVERPKQADSACLASTSAGSFRTPREPAFCVVSMRDLGTRVMGHVAHSLPVDMSATRLEPTRYSVGRSVLSSPLAASQKHFNRRIWHGAGRVMALQVLRDAPLEH